MIVLIIEIFNDFYLNYFRDAPTTTTKTIEGEYARFQVINVIKVIDV